MSTHADPPETPLSPLAGADDVTTYARDLPAPQPHTEAELEALLGLLAMKPQPRTVAIGHSRDGPSAAAAEAFASAWQARGGQVLAVVNWPETAASWLRPATRLTAGGPDAWVIAAGVLGFAQLARRLRHSTDFDPARAFAFATLNDSRLTALTGPAALHGLRGASADGGTWDVRRGWVTSYPRSGERV
ncbi:hypothetical protein [Streptomyces sp. NPDC088358]|uniref:hypothetical protein n=1 Tax=Streptomyces sp. NPDC088358 TaxID=3365857 RepID=UPI0037FE2A5F